MTSAPRILPLALALAAQFMAPAEGRAQTPPTRTLADVVRRALDVHPSLEAARQAVAAAAAGMDAARAAYVPGLTAQGSAIRFQEPMVVAPIHAFDPMNPPDFDRTLIQGSVGLSWTLFDGGRRGADMRHARALQGAAAADLDDTRAALIQRTAQAYLSLLTARDLVASRQALEAALGEERDRVQRFLDEGAAPRLDLLRVEAELASARAESESARQALDLAAATLGRLLDEDPAVLAEEPLVDPALPDEDDPRTAAADLEKSPRVSAALREVGAADAALSAARAAWLPTVQATSGYTLYSGAETSATGEWQAGLRVSYPLFTGGARGSAVDLARARARAAQARVEITREEVALAADRARTAEAEARARAASLEAAVVRYQELVRVERLALDEGSGVQSDYLRAVAGLDQARTGLAHARREVLDARLALVRALGSLTLEWIDTLMEDRP